MANTTELSPVWGDLPIELVHQILEYFTDLAIAECTYIDNYPNNPFLINPDFASTVYRYWQDFRHDMLFRHQRRRFEQHFRDHWLTRIPIYLNLDRDDWGDHLPLGNCCVRYLPVSDLTLQVNPTVTTDEQVVHHHDPDSEQVTFFLHEPILYYHSKHSPLYAVFTDGHADALPNIVTEAWEQIVANDGHGVGTVSFAVGIHRPASQFQETWAKDLFRSWTLSFDVDGLNIMNEGRQIQFRWKPLITGFLRDFSTSMENLAAAVLAALDDD